MDFEWHDYVGAVGVVVLLGTYLALQLNRIAAQTLLYSQLNALGSGLILVSLTQDFNMSACVIEVCWFIISLVGAAVSIWNPSDRSGGILPPHP